MTARTAVALLLALVAGGVTLARIGHHTVSAVALIVCVAACTWSLVEVCRGLPMNTDTRCTPDELKEKHI